MLRSLLESSASMAVSIDASEVIEETVSLEENSGEVSAARDPNEDVFCIDLSSIKAVSLSDQAAELKALNLAVYDQEVMEQSVLQQVDTALEKRQLDKAIKDVCQDIRSSQQQQRKAQEVLATGGSKGQMMILGKEIETRHKKLTTLRAQLASLKEKRTKQESVQPTEDKTDLLHVGVIGETETEHKIRLGEMTPFGTTLGSAVSSISRSEGLSEFEKYLQRQEQLQMSRTKDLEKRGKLEDQSKEHRPALKRRILQPHKGRKKERLGTTTSEVYRGKSQSAGPLLSEQTALEDSDYVPSEGEWAALECEEVDILRMQLINNVCWSDLTVVKKSPRRAKNSKVRRKRMTSSRPADWGSDDSDWEYSDDESRAKRRSRCKKEIDDGNVEDYQERLKLLEGQGHDVYPPHELDEGFKQRCGGILGDEMGLGKTVQIIALLAGLHYSKLVSKQAGICGLGPTLIVCPTTVMHQWVKEFHTWWPPLRVAVLHMSGSYTGKREHLIGNIISKGGILITSYVGVVQHKTSLLARNWHYLILDEGHKIRNPDSQVTLAVKQFCTPHRLILSGSPMQNSLKELWSLFDFVFPGKLGTLPVFLAQLAVPITEGGYANASEVQVATAYKCASVLRDTIAPYLLRRMKTDVGTHISLPPKSEQVLFCRLTEEQRRYYKAYLESGEVERILKGTAQIFVGLIALRKICNHPDLFSGGNKLFTWENEDCLKEEDRFGYWSKAGKMLVVKSLLKIWHKQGHRVLLFTQSRQVSLLVSLAQAGTQMLCILEKFVQTQGYCYLKLDGGTSISARQPLINKFNTDSQYFVFLLTTRVGGLGVNLTGADRVVIYDPDWNPATDTQARERAWRIGQRNRVTVYRLITAGTIEEKVTTLSLLRNQQNHKYIKKGATMEEIFLERTRYKLYMYHRQIFKQFLANKVLSDPRQRRFFKTNDLFELFTLKESDQDGSTETAAIFAGTGSEVKVKPKSLSRDRTNKHAQEYVRKSTSLSNPMGSSSLSSTLSVSKIEDMKKLAQRLNREFTDRRAALPSSDTTEPSSCDATKSTNCDITESPSCDATKSTNCDITESLGCDVTKSTNCDITESPGCDVTKSTNCDITESPGCDVTKSTNCDITESPGCDVTKSTNCDIIKSPVCDVTKSTNCDITESPGCDVTKSTNCDITESPGCDVTKSTNCDIIEPPSCNVIKSTNCDITESPSCNVIKSTNCDIIEPPSCNSRKLPNCNVRESPSVNFSESPSSNLTISQSDNLTESPGCNHRPLLMLHKAPVKDISTFYCEQLEENSQQATTSIDKSSDESRRATTSVDKSSDGSRRATTSVDKSSDESRRATTSVDKSSDGSRRATTSVDKSSDGSRRATTSVDKSSDGSKRATTSADKSPDRSRRARHVDTGTDGERHRKKRRGGMFEGKYVPYLVKQASVAKSEELNQSQDDYVLRKLFNKSGLQTSLCHDSVRCFPGMQTSLCHDSV
uniref:DNA repair and recombination protein RAD54-like n=2 Tax=Timema TaxID=61471 RepID=A0A7R9EMN1_9NEOP|nr:unnamed protein product [Timema monikensis]